MMRRRVGKQKEELLSMLVIPPARRRSTRPLCAMSGLRLTGARLRQLEASGHADAVAEWVRRRDDINKGLWKDGTLRVVQVVHLKQKEELLSKLVIPPKGRAPRCVEIRPRPMERERAT